MNNLISILPDASGRVLVKLAGMMIDAYTAGISDGERPLRALETMRKPVSVDIYHGAVTLVEDSGNPSSDVYVADTLEGVIEVALNNAASHRNDNGNNNNQC